MDTLIITLLTCYTVVGLVFLLVFIRKKAVPKYLCQPRPFSPVYNTIASFFFLIWPLWLLLLFHSYKNQGKK